MERIRKEIIMKKNFRVITKTIAILASLSLLTACGKTGTTSTYYSPDNDADTATAVNIDVEDLGTEEYFIAEAASYATDEDKQRAFKYYLEKALEKDVETLPSVKDASIAFAGTDAIEYVNILLDLENELAEDDIVTIAEAAANATELSIDNITIMDADGTVLYMKE